MYCSRCGKEINDDDTVFCPKCGQQIQKEDNVAVENNEISEQESRAHFFVRLILSVIVGVLLGFITLLLTDEMLLTMMISVLAGVYVAIIARALFGESNLRGLVAIIVFIVVFLLYWYAFSTIDEVGYDIKTQDIAMMVYMCSPFTIWAMFITDKRKGNPLLFSLIKQLAIWIVILLICFIGFSVERDYYLAERDQQKYNTFIDDVDKSDEKDVSNQAPTNDNANEDLEKDEMAEVINDDIYLAVINTYYGVSNYMNGNELVEFDIMALQTICDNWEVIKESGLFEAPIDVEEYIAMRSGETVQFYYDGGVSLIWTKETNDIYISDDGE